VINVAITTVTAVPSMMKRILKKQGLVGEIMMSRRIKDHTIYGYAVIVHAEDEDSARQLALVGKTATHYVWEIKKIDDYQFECYVARHEDAFANND
jgi:hypothetical protein